MFKLNLRDVDKLIVYGNGKKYLEKTRDFAKVGVILNDKYHNPYGDTITEINLAQEPKNARKENLNRTDNYYLTFKDEIFRNERKTAVYIHVSEVEVDDLGEFVAFEANGEKDYLYLYKVTFRNGATAKFYRAEHMKVDKGWKIPEEEFAAGARWSNTYNTNAPTYDTLSERAERKTGCNLIKRYVEFGTITENYYTSEGYHKTEKDDDRKNREEIAALMNKVLGQHKVSHYDVADLQKYFDITIKA